jgi:hypothetical protein
MAHIPQRNTHLRWTTRTSERAQLIHDEETNTYLNYRQLLQHQKYSEIWSKSLANEFGRLTKAEENRTRFTMGGDRINYPDDCGTPTMDMILFKKLINSIISTPNAKCLMMNINDFYLNTPMNDQSTCASNSQTYQKK